MPVLRRLRLVALVPLLALAVSACSQLPGSGSPGVPGSLSKIGITTAAVDVEALAGQYVVDEEGITYVASVEEGAAEVSLVRVLWDGSEPWTLQVPVPEGATAATARLSTDPGLGIVSVWFTPEHDPQASPLDLFSSMASPTMTRVDVATGTAEELDFSGDTQALGASDSESNRSIIGVVHKVEADVSVGITYATADADLETIAWEELPGEESVVFNVDTMALTHVEQWQGQVITVVDPMGARAVAGISDQLYMGRTQVLTGLDTWASEGTGEYYVVYIGSDEEEDAGAEVLLLSADAATSPIDVPECAEPQWPGIDTDGDHAYVGGLDIDLAAGTATCVEDLAPTSSAELAGGFSDGAYLFKGSDSNYWIVTGDGSQTIPLTDIDSGFLMTSADHIISVSTEEEVTSVRAYRWSEASL